MPRLSQPPQLSEESLHQLACHVVAYMMTRSDDKVPAKRADIIKQALVEHHRSYDVVLEKVEELVKFFGLKMIKIDRPVKAVMLANTCRDMFVYSEKTPEEKATGVLRLLVLSFIFMRNNSVRDDILWDFLQKLGLVKESTTFIHSYFGDVKKLVSKTFVRQMYLECCKVPNSDPPYLEYSMGKRALVEIPKRNLLEFVCKMYGSDSLDIFRAHLEIVVKEEEEADKASDCEVTVPASGETLCQSELPGPSSASKPGRSSASKPGRSSASKPGRSSASEPGPSSAPQPGMSSGSQPVKRSSSYLSRQVDTDHSHKRRKH